MPSRPFFATLPPGSPGPTELGTVRWGSNERFHSLGELALVHLVVGAGFEDRWSAVPHLGVQNTEYPSESPVSPMAPRTSWRMG